MYDQIIGRDGISRPIKNTVDQIEGLRFPKSFTPRRVVVIAHAQHMMRLLHIMSEFQERIPPTTVIQAFPLPSSGAARRPHTIMELRGTLNALYQTHKAHKEPYPFKL